MLCLLTACYGLNRCDMLQVDMLWSSWAELLRAVQHEQPAKACAVTPLQVSNRSESRYMYIHGAGSA